MVKSVLVSRPIRVANVSSGASNMCNDGEFNQRVAALSLHRKADWLLFPLLLASELFAPLPCLARSGDANFYDGTNATEITTPNALLAGKRLGDEYITVLIKNLPYRTVGEREPRYEILCEILYILGFVTR